MLTSVLARLFTLNNALYVRYMSVLYGEGTLSKHASWLNALHRLAEPEIRMKAMVV